MGTGDSWLERVQAAKGVFREVDVSGQANKMLARNRHNRIVLQGKQATCLVALRLMSSQLGNHAVGADKKEQEKDSNPWAWISDFSDMVEDYQLTLGSPKNSRDMFLAALKREMSAQPGSGGSSGGFGK